MTTTPARGRSARGGRTRIVVALMAVLAGLLATAPADARPEPGRPSAVAVPRIAAEPDRPFDVRADGSTVVLGAAVVRAQRALAASLGPAGVVDVDERTGTPRVIARLDGFLTGPSSAEPADIALAYVRSHLPAFGITRRDLAGLVLVKDYVDILGTHHLIWQQRYRGLALWDSDLRAHVTSQGRLVAIGGSMLPGLSVETTSPSVSARSAIAATYRSVGVAAPTLAGSPRSIRGPERRTSFRSGDEARLVLFGTPRGARLAWRTTSFVDSQRIFVSVVDARTAELLWRANVVENDQAGTGQAWDYYPSASIPNGGGVAHPVSFPVADGSALSGNNATTFPDVDDDDEPDRQIPASSGLDWTYPAPLDTSDASEACSVELPCTWSADTPFSWEANVSADAVQVFHFLNAFHDHLLAAPIGFTEAAGNFQVQNASGQGRGGDPVVANVMDGADTHPNRPGLPDGNHVYNANMFVPPDGEPPRMQMYLFPSIPFAGVASTTGGDDASVVYHEYTHGLSNRLVTLADGNGALNAAQAGAMGEAWSDFYALDFLVSQGFEVDSSDADVILGRYVGGGNSLLRTEPIDCAVGASFTACPGSSGAGTGGYTYGDFGRVVAGPEVHADGEIWGQTLWDIRKALGSITTLSLVTRGMELSPPEPSFLDMRNAILEADLVAFGGTHTTRLWEVFAARGMGFFAITNDASDPSPVEDFSVPPTCPGDCGVVAGKVTDRRTGKPVRGLVVAVAGHASGFLGDLADTTNRRGEFEIAEVPFHDYVLTVGSDEHEPVARHVDVNGDEVVAIRLTRDWAALGGGARLVGFSGPDYTPQCGPGFAWDTSLSTGWGSDHPNFDGGSGTTGERTNVVRLPQPIDISAFGFATNGTCGDGPEAAVRVFEIQTRTGSGRWETAYRRNTALRLGVLHTLRPARGTGDAVRFLRLVMLDNYGDRQFMDVLELTVRGAPA